MRVSSMVQAKEGDSIPAQRDALLKYINDRPGPNWNFSGNILTTVSPGRNTPSATNFSAFWMM